MDKNSPDWKKYKQEQADFLKRNQDALDKKHNIGRYTNTRNTRNPQGYKPYKKGEKPPKVKTYTRGFNIGHIKQDKQDAINDLGNKLSEVESREGWNKTKARIKGLGRRIYPDEGRHGEGGQTSIENPEFHGEKRTGLFGQKQKPSKETAVSEEKPLEELTDGELSEVEKLMVKKMTLRNEGTVRHNTEPDKHLLEGKHSKTDLRVRGHGVGTPMIRDGKKVARTAEDVTTPSGNEVTNTKGDKQMAGILGTKDNAKPTKEQMDEYLDIAHYGERPKTESFSRKKRESQADLEAKFEHPDYNIATGEIEHGFRNRKKKGGIKEKLRKLVTVPDIYPSEIKNIESRERREKASKEKEVECPHCSGEGRMAMSFGYGAGVGTCRNCGGKGKGTEFHYTDTEGNMKKSWESWLEIRKDALDQNRDILPKQEPPKGQDFQAQKPRVGRNERRGWLKRNPDRKYSRLYIEPATDSEEYASQNRRGQIDDLKTGNSPKDIIPKKRGLYEDHRRKEVDAKAINTAENKKVIPRRHPKGKPPKAGSEPYDISQTKRLDERRESMRRKKSWEIWLEKKKDQGQGDARYGNPHETGMEDPRKLQTTKDDFSMEEKKIIKKMTRYNTKPYIQIERDSN